MDCANCGAPQVEGMVACPHCGATLAQTSPMATGALPPPPPPPPPPPGSPTIPMAPVGQFATQQLPVAPPPPPPPAPEAPGATTRGRPTSAYVGVIACGVGIVAAGLPWFTLGGSNANGFDFPLQSLWSDQPVLPSLVTSIGMALVVFAAIGLVAALASSNMRVVGRVMMIAGIAQIALLGWMLVRFQSSAQGGFSILSFLGYGIWIAIAAALVAAISGKAISGSAKN